MEGQGSTEPSLCGQLRNGGWFWLPSQSSSVLSAQLLAAKFRLNGACLASVPGLQQPPRKFWQPLSPQPPAPDAAWDSSHRSHKGPLSQRQAVADNGSSATFAFQTSSQPVLPCGQSGPVAETTAIGLRSPP